jgi:nitrogen-specific signal transduction histidine kinase
MVSICEPVDKYDKLSLLTNNGFEEAKIVLNLIPCAIALWTPDRLLYTLNDRAVQLIGFSDRDFGEDACLWLNRIHPSDRGLFSTAWKKLLGGEKMVSCDYRFSPNKSDKDIWLRDTSVSHQNAQGEVKGIASAYVDISDIRARQPKSPQKGKEADVGEVIAGIVHEIKNNLQVISTGFDLSYKSSCNAAETRAVTKAIGRANRSVQELYEYFFLPELQFSMVHPGTFLEEVIRHTEKELHLQGVRIRLHHQDSLPLIPLDSRQFRKALGQVLKFSLAVLPEGGELEIETQLEKLGSRQYIKLQVVSSSASAMEVKERDVFRPYLRVNGHQLGLGIMMAKQIVRRHKGEIFFRKESPKRGRFTILLEAR